MTVACRGSIQLAARNDSARCGSGQEDLDAALGDAAHARSATLPPPNRGAAARARRRGALAGAQGRQRGTSTSALLLGGVGAVKVKTLALMGERSAAVPNAPRGHSVCGRRRELEAAQPELRPDQREPVGGERVNLAPNGSHYFTARRASRPSLSRGPGLPDYNSRVRSSVMALAACTSAIRSWR